MRLDSDGEPSRPMGAKPLMCRRGPIKRSTQADHSLNERLALSASVFMPRSAMTEENLREMPGRESCWKTGSTPSINKNWRQVEKRKTGGSSVFQQATNTVGTAPITAMEVFESFHGHAVTQYRAEE